MIHIFLVRHGETVWHAENRYAGRSEVGLSDEGKEQARKLARWAKTVGIERLRVSPQLRAMETMRPVAETLSIDPIVDPRWREIDFGLGEGMTAKEMAEKMPEERRKFDADPVTNPLPGGEDPRSAIVRGRAALHAAVEEAARSGPPSPRTLVVCHSTLIRLLLCDALGINPSLYRKVFPRLGCAEITELGFSIGTGSSPVFASLLRFNVPAEPSTSKLRSPFMSSLSSENDFSSRKILVAGDHFVTPELLDQRLRQTIGANLHISKTTTPFPLEPFRDIAEVREASGSEDQMIDALKGIEICVAHHAPLTKKVLDASPSLRLFVICRGGPVNANLAAASQAGVRVGFTPGRNATAAAEFAIAAALSALRGIPSADQGVRAGKWPGDYTYQSAGFEIEGSTCGLIGYGAIGRRVARILRGFGARVLAYDPYATIDAAEGVEQVSLEELLSRSRIVSLHARQSPESKGMIGRDQIAKMPRGSVLVNCARGGLLDYDALEDALRSGHLFAAAADVFPEEPLPSHSSVRDLPNFILTPHIAGGTKQAAEKAAWIASEEVARYLHGEPLRFCANPDLQRKAGA